MPIDSAGSKKRSLIWVWVCLGIILSNFVAQVPYFVHLYARTQPLSTDIRSFLIMGSVFAFFLAGTYLFSKRRETGFWLLSLFLLVEFLFYALNTIRSVLHGYPLFFQAANPDLTLRIIYSIGYLNLFASGCCLFLLVRNRSAFTSLTTRTE